MPQSGFPAHKALPGHLIDGPPILWSETLTFGTGTKCKCRRHLDLLVKIITGWTPLEGNVKFCSPHPTVEKSTDLGSAHPCVLRSLQT